MTELDKAKVILKVLSTTKLEFNGAREAFVFTEAYQWLLNAAKELEETSKKAKNVNNKRRQTRK